MPDREVLDPAASFDPSPAYKKRFRVIPPALRRRTVVLPILATLLLGANAWMVLAIQGWKDDADGLRSESTDLGESLASVQTQVERVEAEAELLADQRTAAEDRVDELALEAAAERDLVDAFTDVSQDLAECTTDRLEIIRGLWEHGSAFVADLEEPTIAECEAAQANLDDLMAAGE